VKIQQPKVDPRQAPDVLSASAQAAEIAPARAERRREFWAGARATLPLVVGAVPFGIIFGAVAVNSGLSAWATAALSLFVFAGASQFVAAGLVAGGAGLLVIILTTFVVNLRHSRQPCALCQKSAAELAAAAGLYVDGRDIPGRRRTLSPAG
jgi:predicted branched-subunit amino acid permease